MKKRILGAALVFFAFPAIAGAFDYALYVQVDDTVHIIDRDAGEYAGSYVFQGGGIPSLWPTPGGAAVFVSDNDNVEIFSAETGRPEGGFEDDWSDIGDLSFVPTGERVFILDRGRGKIDVYQHRKLSLEHSGSIDFPAGEFGNVVFNGRGTRYFALGQEDGASLLVGGDGINGRVLSSLELDFEAQLLRVSGNDRFAWIAGTEQLVLADLRKNKIIRKITGSFTPKTLVIEENGNRTIVLNDENNEIIAFNRQNGKKLLASAIPAGYTSLLLDEEDNVWLIPHSTSLPFLVLTIKGNRTVESRNAEIAGLPDSLRIGSAALGSRKYGGNFACF
ncbi:MAG: YncE family protein [Salinispira sp.]